MYCSLFSRYSWQSFRKELGKPQRYLFLLVCYNFCQKKIKWKNPPPAILRLVIIEQNIFFAASLTVSFLSIYIFIYLGNSWPIFTLVVYLPVTETVFPLVRTKLSLPLCVWEVYSPFPLARLMLTLFLLAGHMSSLFRLDRSPLSSFSPSDNTGNYIFLRLFFLNHQFNSIYYFL